MRNYGTINMAGDNVMGIAGQNGAQIYNDYSGIINVSGNDVTGIYLADDGTEIGKLRNYKYNRDRTWNSLYADSGIK